MRPVPIRISRQLGAACLAVLLGLLLAGLARAETLTMPRAKRPAWLTRDGIVMAGSWEPLVFRVRRDGAPGYTPTAEQLAGYQREHSPEMVAQLKSLGVNFVMMHCHKGGGLKAEGQSMADAAAFARLCHEAGLHVGVYTYSGAFLWELLFKEVPQAEQWVVCNEKGKVTYGSAGYRYYWNRNHPDAEAYYRQIVRYAVNDIRTDLLHFDNYGVGPGRDANSVQRFRQYLRQQFQPDRLAQAGITTPIDSIEPPGKDSPLLLRCAWADFSCQSLADSYFRMARYARSLRPDVLIECNPLGVGPVIYPPVDHGRLLQGGEAYWDESGLPGYRNGSLRCRVRTYKVARGLDNSAFSYITTPLEAAESMAFNLDCLGAICWFEYGKLVERPGSNVPMSEKLRPYVRFFREHRDLLRDADVVADVAVLRSFPSQVFAEAKHGRLTSRVEDMLIMFRVPFQILYDHQLADLGRYRTLVLAGCVALGDPQIQRIRQFVASGGRLCVIGLAATHDPWMTPRARPALDDLAAAQVVRAAENQDWLDAIRRSSGGRFSLSVDPTVFVQRQGGTAAAPGAAAERLSGLCAELTQQPNRRLVHLVNYRSDGPLRDLVVRVALPAGWQVHSVMLSSPERDSERAARFQEEPRGVTFVVPEVGVYEVAAIRRK